MRAAWYEQRGPARDVLVVGEMPLPAPGEGEVRIQLAFSGISPGDVKKRSGWLGSPMPYPRVVPHSDGAGLIDAVGPGVPTARIRELEAGLKVHLFERNARGVRLTDAGTRLYEHASRGIESLEDASRAVVHHARGWHPTTAFPS